MKCYDLLHIRWLSLFLATLSNIPAWQRTWLRTLYRCGELNQAFSMKSKHFNHLTKAPPFPHQVSDVPSFYIWWTRSTLGTTKNSLKKYIFSAHCDTSTKVTHHFMEIILLIQIRNLILLKFLGYSLSTHLVIVNVSIRTYEEFWKYWAVFQTKITCMHRILINSI